MLAIIIPYYKLAFFDATLHSLANQTDKRFKVYIGDDASEENPAILLGKYGENFEYEYTRFNNNLGRNSLVKHWERCMALVKNEEWLIILGDDDVLGENCISDFYKNLDKIKKTSNVVRYASCNIDENGKKISKVFQNLIVESSIDFFFKERRSSLSEYVFNKEKIFAVGLKNFPLAWCTDILAVLEVSGFENVYSINDSIVYIRISQLSISGNKMNKKLKTRASVDFLYYMIIKKGQYFDQFQKSKLADEMVRIFLNNKKNGRLFVKLSIYFFSNNLFRDYFNFIKSIFLNLQNQFKKKQI